MAIAALNMNTDRKTISNIIEVIYIREGWQHIKAKKITVRQFYI